MPVPASASGSATSRSATISSASSSGAASTDCASTTWCPAAVSPASTRLASIKSVAMLTTRAIERAPGLDGAALAELLADAFRSSPPGHDLGAALAHLGDSKLAGDLLGVELRQHT